MDWNCIAGPGAEDNGNRSGVFAGDGSFVSGDLLAKEHGGSYRGWKRKARTLCRGQ
jgi:hypothetical protein